jgi:hypothetical protein
MPIKWETLITEGDGRISHHRLRKFLALILGALGGLVIVAAMVIGMFTEISTAALFTGGGLLVAPITGGQVADAISGKFHSDRVNAGKAPGRRATDRPNGNNQGSD